LGEHLDDEKEAQRPCGALRARLAGRAGEPLAHMGRQ
jgi:hypothetical protein